VLKEVLDQDDVTFAVGLDGGDALLSLDTAVLPVNNETPTNEKSIPEVDDLLNASVRSPRFPQTSPEGDHGLSSVEALLGPAGIGTDEDVCIDGRRDGVPIPAPEGVVPLLEGIQVRPRHRLPRQSHGFESLGSGGTDEASMRFAVAHAPGVEKLSLGLDTACVAPS
jgi:hypothetical protein